MKTLLLQSDNGIATLTLNRPEKNNAFDDVLIKELLQTLQNLAQEPNLKILILQGAGKNFCAGADINWMQRMKDFSYEENLADAQQLALLFQTLYEFPKPTLAAIQGHVAGGGLGLIACCDIAIATDNSTYCFSEAKLGLIPATISPYIINAIGSRAAQRYFLTAEKFSALEAKNLGLIHAIEPGNDLTKSVNYFCELLLANSTHALTQIKQLIRRNYPIPAGHLQSTSELLARIRTSPEALQRLQAFLSKNTAQS